MNVFVKGTGWFIICLGSLIAAVGLGAFVLGLLSQSPNTGGTPAGPLWFLISAAAGVIGYGIAYLGDKAIRR